MITAQQEMKSAIDAMKTGAFDYLRKPFEWEDVRRVLEKAAALSGVIVFQLASLTDVHWTMSGEVVLMTLLGGMGTVFGPIVGAFIVIAMQNYLAQLGSWVTVSQGLVFVVCVLAFRRGIIGELSRFLKKPL